MSDDQVLALYEDTLAEVRKRETMRTAVQRMEDLSVDYLHARGDQEGDEWVQPEGYLGVYPKGWTVTHGGKTWVSLIDGNSLEPGVSGWREQTPEGEPPPEYVPPAGYQDAYNTGDRVTFQGDVYECLSDGVTWSPAEAPQHWKR